MWQAASAGAADPFDWHIPPTYGPTEYRKDPQGVNDESQGRPNCRTTRTHSNPPASRTFFGSGFNRPTPAGIGLGAGFTKSRDHGKKAAIACDGFASKVHPTEARAAPSPMGAKARCLRLICSTPVQNIRETCSLNTFSRIIQKSH